MLEEFKKIEGFPNYLVSNFGRVKRLEHTVLQKKRSYVVKELFLKQHTHKNGYKCVTLYSDVVKTFLVHKLVADAFLPNPLNLPCINHINENKSDNRVCNLEWCSYSYNINYGTRNKRVSCKMTNGKLSKQINRYSLDGSYIDTWVSLHEIERVLGYYHTNISRCCKGLQKQAYGFVWRYASDVA